MSDMRTVAIAVEERGTDFKEYPVAPSLDALATLLEPKYIKNMPRNDGWGRPFRYEAWSEPGQSVVDRYAISSAGRNGTFEKSSAREYTRAKTTRLEDDIVYSNGFFDRCREGMAPW